MRSRLAQLSLFGVALLIGLLLVGQLRSQQRPVELRRLTPQELSGLVQSLGQRNRELQTALSAQLDQLGSYKRADIEGRSQLELGQQEVLTLDAFAGLGPVQGRGVVIDIRGFLDWIAVNDLLNELRNSRAEAIAIDGLRITARSVATQGVDGLVIDGQAIGSSFEVSAIGEPTALTNAITGPGGLKSQLEVYAQATLTIREEPSILVPATRRDLGFVVAKPVE